MNRASIIALGIVVALVTMALRTMRKARKSGVQCIGCPDSGGCCHCHAEEKQ